MLTVYTVTYSMITEVTTVVLGSAGAVGSGACSETVGAVDTGASDTIFLLETWTAVDMGVDVWVAEAPSVTYCVMTDSKSLVSVLGSAGTGATSGAFFHSNSPVPTL